MKRAKVENITDNPIFKEALDNFFTGISSWKPRPAAMIMIAMLYHKLLKNFFSEDALEVREHRAILESIQNTYGSLHR